jgi:hypothetical protein
VIYDEPEEDESGDDESGDHRDGALDADVSNDSSQTTPEKDFCLPVFRQANVRGWPNHPDGGRGYPTGLHEALTRHWPADAHCTQYQSVVVERRLTWEVLDRAEALAEIGGAIVMRTLLFDVDHAGSHAAGGTGAGLSIDDWWLSELVKVQRLGTFVYRGRGGYRIVYLLRQPFRIRNRSDAAAWKTFYLCCVAYLQRVFGIVADPTDDWQRLFRLPHATRIKAGSKNETVKERDERDERNAAIPVDDYPTIGDPSAVAMWEATFTDQDKAVALTLKRKSETATVARRRTDANNDRATPVLNGAVNGHVDSGGTTGHEFSDVGHGLLFYLFAARGWIGAGLENGKFSILCPKDDEHTKRGLDGSTVLFLPHEGQEMGWVHCSHTGHGHDCWEVADVLAMFPLDEIEAARQAAGVRDRQAENRHLLAGTLHMLAERKAHSAAMSATAPKPVDVTVYGDTVAANDRHVAVRERSDAESAADYAGLHEDDESKQGLTNNPVLARTLNNIQVAKKTMATLASATQASGEPVATNGNQPAAAKPSSFEQATDPGDLPDEDKPQKGPTKAQLLVEIMRGVGIEFAHSPTGRAFAVLDGQAIGCDSKDFVSLCSAIYWQKYRSTIGKSTVEDVIRALTGICRETREIPVRVWRDTSRIVLDLGTSMLAVTDSGIQEVSDALFARPAGFLSLPEPVMPRSDSEAADWCEEMRGLLCLDRPRWVKCIAWLLGVLRGEHPYTILLIRAEQGSGKSTLAACLRRLIDPRRPIMTGAVREPRDLVIRAEHQHILLLDNISSLPGDISDALCRLSTGDGLETRSLYSDRDLAVFDVAAPVLITSVVDAVTRPDLLDRALMLDLPIRRSRRTDAEIMRDFEALRPRVLGALLHAVARGLGSSEVLIPDEVRMRAPAEFAARAAPALGIRAEEIVEAYLTSRGAAHDVLSEDPVVDAVLKWLAPGKEWTGVMGDLLMTLDRQRPLGRPSPRGWPESPRAMGAALCRLAPALRGFGVYHEPPVGRTGHDKDRLHVLRRDPVGPVPPQRPATAPDGAARSRSCKG